MASTDKTPPLSEESAREVAREAAEPAVENEARRRVLSLAQRFRERFQASDSPRQYELEVGR